MELALENQKLPESGVVFGFFQQAIVSSIVHNAVLYSLINGSYINSHRTLGRRPSACQILWPEIIAKYWNRYDITSMEKPIPPATPHLSRIGQLCNLFVGSERQSLFHNFHKF